jgi:HK97 gp10 family phage protein
MARAPLVAAAIDTAGLFARLDSMVHATQEAVRPAAQAGAQVYYEEVRARVPVSEKAHSTKGKKQTYQPGNLRAAIYQAFVESESGKAAATYRISWNKEKAFYGRFLEFGTSQMAARPFLRPGFDAARERALSAAVYVLENSVTQGRT